MTDLLIAHIENGVVTNRAHHDEMPLRFDQAQDEPEEGVEPKPYLGYPEGVSFVDVTERPADGLIGQLYDAKTDTFSDPIVERTIEEERTLKIDELQSGMQAELSQLVVPYDKDLGIVATDLFLGRLQLALSTSFEEKVRLFTAKGIKILPFDEANDIFEHVCQVRARILDRYAVALDSALKAVDLDHLKSILALLLLFLSLFGTPSLATVSDVGTFVRSGTSSVANPVTGQTWLFDTADNTLKVYGGGVAGWLPVTGGRNNLIAVAYPIFSNDGTQGYKPSSVWVNTTDNSVWMCTNAATGAATWTQITNKAGAADLALKANIADVQDTDWIASGWFSSVPGGTTLDCPVPSGVGYVGGNRIAGVGSTQSLTASQDSYFFLLSNGSVVVIGVANGASAPTNAGLLFQKVVTNSTTITGVTNLAPTAPRLKAADATLSSEAATLGQVNSITGGISSAPAYSVFSNFFSSTHAPSFNAPTVDNTFLGRVAGVTGYFTPPGTGGGTVNMVSMTGDGVIFNTTVGGAPITNSGTLVPALLTQAANKVLIGPSSGSAAAPTFRLLVSADLPLINLASGVSGSLPLANGGTAGTDQQTAVDSILGFSSVAKGDMAVYNGTHWVKQAHAANGNYLKYDSTASTGLTADVPAGGGGGMTNPMTAVGDIIVGSTAGAPVRQAKGSDGSYWGVQSGFVGYYALPSPGMSNPMTTQYDLIVGGSSGTPGRVAKGADGTFWGVQSGVGGYYTPPSGSGYTSNTVSANFTANANNVYFVNAASGSISGTLGTAVGNGGKRVYITMTSNAGHNNTTYAPMSGQTINGSSSTRTLSTTYNGVWLMSDNSNWIIE